MFAEEDWSEGADGLAPSRVSPGPLGGAEDPRRPVRGAGGGRAEPPRAPQAPAAAERKRRQRLLATLQRLEASAGTRPCPPADGQPARKRPRRRRRAAGCRAEAEGRPAGSAEPGAGREAPGGGGPGPPPGPPSGATGTGGTRAAAGNGTQRAPRRCGAGGRAAAERDRSGAESRRAAVPAPPVPRGVPAEPPADRPAWSSEPEGPGTGASAAGPAQRLTRQQWRNKQKNKRRQKNKLRGGPGEEKEADVEAGTGAGASEPPALEAAPVGRSAALRARMEERLLSARFRYINQQLYTSSSQEAVKLFQNDPEAFQIYHRGFAQQVGRWPENPVDRIIRYLRKRPASLVVADFGCGDCKIASSVRNKVHSFDLVPLSPLVTVCDMAKVPLEAESVDVAVFCLALMGTNLQEILEEANRVLKQGGTLLVAEVASRFEDIRAFMSAMAQLGFKSVSKDLSSPFFFLLEFSKTAPPRPRPCAGLRLRPCRYKRR